MKKYFLNIFRGLLKQLFTDKQISKLILQLSKDFKIDLLFLAHNNMGILKYQNAQVSGEVFFVDYILKRYVENIKEPILFDVGANIGKYTKMLSQKFIGSTVYAFEPNYYSFDQLKKINENNIKCYNVGLGSENSLSKIYTYADNLTSSHTSVYKEVLSDIHKAAKVEEIEFKIITLDSFCKEFNINNIDLLKIDTEGHELAVLKGALEMIKNGNIKIIQFEFNEMNVISRVFLKDFYDLLIDYKIFRVDTNNLIPLFNYSSVNEIFRFQNFLAIHKSAYQSI